MKICVSSKAMYQGLKVFKNRIDFIEKVTVFEGGIILHDWNQSVNSKIYCHVQESPVLVNNKCNGRFDWLRNLCHIMPDQPITIEFTEHNINIHIQY